MAAVDLEHIAFSAMRSIPSQKDGSCYIVSLKENEINNTDKPWSQTQQAELIGAMNGLQIMLACCLNWVIFDAKKEKKMKRV